MYICVWGEGRLEKLNKPSFGYYKFISAGHFMIETNLFR